MNPNCPAKPTCGDNQITAWEECDGGNALPGDGCDAKCQVEWWCGNSVKDTNKGETCDDGNKLNGDGCDAGCLIEDVCGDKVCGPSESCITCVGDCGACSGVCGNGVIESGEECDDGPDGSPCCYAPPSCKKKPCAPVCGNKTVEPPEECDDGNLTPGDGCSGACELEGPPPDVCGNGIVEPPEESCDDSCLKGDPAKCDAADDGDGCSQYCKSETKACSPSPCCGDGKNDDGEQCDDGCTKGDPTKCDVGDNGDGCDMYCKNEGVTQPFGLKGTVKFAGSWSAADKISVMGFKTAVPDCQSIPQGEGNSWCGKDIQGAQVFPLAYECPMQDPASVYPVAIYDQGSDGQPDACVIYAPAPVVVVQDVWKTGIDFDFAIATGGTAEGTVTCATCAPVAADSMTVLITENAPPFSLSNTPKNKITPKKFKPIPSFPKTFSIPNVPAGSWYVSAKYDKGDNNDQGPAGPGDKGPACYKVGASCSKVTFTKDQTTGGINITL